ncbi:MAG: flagellar basal body rod protein FlgC [Peptococcaceae bacterium]|jgi:flagellar basal-body rod protein FlgC|nr:flagellar basal body rod protein FlgC [Peptococcaceae bacterium]
MAFMTAMNIVGSGLTAEQLRLDVISENVTNMNTTRTEAGGPYRRKMVVFQAESGRDGFRQAMAAAAAASNRGYENAGGVRVVEIVEDPSDLPITYDPSHPDANEQGYVEMPNITLVKEITDAMAASRAYASNVTAFNTLKSVLSSSLEIGR